MTSLAALQSAFQQRVLHGTSAIESRVAGEERDIATRLGIYEHAYRARLTAALGVTYPVLRSLLGEREFARIAASRIARDPPRHASIRWYGADLHRELRGLPAELARWEWLLAEVFDAADDAALTEADLAALRPQDWPGLRLRLHRTARCLATTTAAVACWQAVTRGRPCEPTAGSAPTAWIAWRRDLSIRFRSVSREEARALAQVSDGVTFATLCAGLAGRAGESAAALRAATFLKGWISEGLVGR